MIRVWKEENDFRKKAKMLAEKNKKTEENVFWKYGRVKITREDDHYIIQFDTESDPIKNSLGKHIYHGIPSWKERLG